MTNEETTNKTSELSNHYLGQASGGNTVNQLWGDYFYVDVTADDGSPNKLTTETTNDPGAARTLSGGPSPARHRHTVMP